MMKPITLTLAIFALLQIHFVPLKAQNWAFAKRFSPQAGGYIENKAVALAPDGSTYVVGNFRGTVDFDTVSISRPVNATDDYGFLLKLDASLQPLWARSFPHRTFDVTTDAQGNAFMVGSRLASHTDSLAFVAKYAPDGILLDTFSASGTADSWGKVVRTDAMGNCYIAGERFSAGQAIFGGINPTPAGGRDCFLAKLSPDLSQVLWVVYTGASPNLDNVYDIEVDKNGFVYTSGNYSQNYSIGCFCYNGSFYTEKHNAATGVSIWKKIFASGSGTDTEQLLSLDSSGQSVYVSASFKHTTTFQSGISLTAAANSDYHIYLAKMDASNGNVQWAEKLALTGDNYPTRLARQGAELYLNGYFFSPVLFGDTLLNQQGVDAFLVEAGSMNGTVLSAEKFSGFGGEYGYGLDTQDSVMVVSGNSSSSNLTIGSFSLPGSVYSIYVARKGNAPPVTSPPVAAFAASPTLGCAPFSVQFNSSNSTGNPTGYNWQFPGGTPASSNDPNPLVQYTVPGNYSVTLTVGNAGGTNTAFQSNFITVNPIPTTVFTSNINGLAVTFTNASTNANVYQWDFGDGQSSSLQNPVHTYADCGTYTVTLTSTNLCGTASSTAIVTVGSGLPTAAFTSSVNGLVVTLTNASTNTNAYLWDFGDGQSSSLQNPVHTYADCGTYTVTLTGTNICGTASSTASVTVGSGSPVPAFTSSVNGLVVTLTNASTNTNSYLWDFGDGQSSSLQNPVHTYADCGTYTVTLTGTNICGTASNTATVMAGNSLPITSFTNNVNGFAVTFTNSSTNAVSYLWDFGDTQISSEQNPTHNYADCGTYTVILTSTNACGTASSTANVTISVSPTAMFSTTVDGLQVTFLNTSTGGTSYFWEFGDGDTSMLQSPLTHVYPDSGTYVITLVVTNNCGAAIFQQVVTISTVGTGTPVSLQQFTLFPNPNSGHFWLAMKGDWGDKIEFSILNSNGLMVFAETISPQTESLAQWVDLGNVPKGVYWLRIRTGGESWMQKMVVAW